MGVTVCVFVCVCHILAGIALALVDVAAVAVVAVAGFRYNLPSYFTFCWQPL